MADRPRSWRWAGLGPALMSAFLAFGGGSKGDGPPPAQGHAASIREARADQEKLAKKREHASVDAALLRSIDRAVGQQVRVYRNESDFAVFTVSETTDDHAEPIVRMGRPARLRVGPSEAFEGRIVPTVVGPTLTVEQAKSRGELIESLDDDGRNTGLLLMAPHGGELEPPTDQQAERVAAQLQSKRTSTWRCQGYHPRGGKAAFDRWHITSTDISEASYPKLARVANRTFEYAVSFHGMAEDRILIGGNAPTRLRREIRDAIREAINDPKTPVDLSLPGEANGGLDAKNIVNRYTKAGVQIEQSPRARREHWKAIADAVAKVFASKL